MACNTFPQKPNFWAQFTKLPVVTSVNPDRSHEEDVTILKKYVTAGITGNTSTARIWTPQSVQHQFHALGGRKATNLPKIKVNLHKNLPNTPMDSHTG